MGVTSRLMAFGQKRIDKAHEKLDKAEERLRSGEGSEQERDRADENLIRVLDRNCKSTNKDTDGSCIDCGGRH